MKNLNNKLETMDGAIPEGEENDFSRIMNGRVTLNEYQKASRAAIEADDAKGDCELDESDMEKLGEDLWCLLKDKLEGVEPRGKLKGLHEGDGLMTYQKIYKW